VEARPQPARMFGRMVEARMTMLMMMIVVSMVERWVVR
jgi:hypothetical protein